MIRNPTGTLARERSFIKKVFLNRNTRPSTGALTLNQVIGTLTERLGVERSQEKCPNRKTDTQTADHKPKSKTCPRKKTHWEDVFPTGKRTPKQEITNPTERLATEKRLIKKMPSQQEDRHPNRKSQTQQKVLILKEDSLRKCLPDRRVDTQTGNHKPNRKTCPRKKTH